MNSNNPLPTGATDEVKTAAEQAAANAALERVGLMESLFSEDINTLRTRLDGAASELDREMGVRERCFKNWIEQGKISRIDATDRYTRMAHAQEIINFLLDVCGKPVKMTDDAVPF